MRPLIFIDLDDTLFHTARKCPPGVGHVGAVGRNGEPRSFLSPRQKRFFDFWLLHGEVIPCTGRSVAAYERVVLGFRGAAICSFGACLRLADGTVDARWWAEMEPAVSRASGPLRELLGQVESLARGHDLNVRCTLVEECGLPIYLSVKHHDEAGDLKPFADLLRPLLSAEWWIHRNGSNMALLPAHLGKHTAVARYLREYLSGEPAFVMGFGDSISDLPFMRLCDFGAAPATSQIMQLLEGYT